MKARSHVIWELILVIGSVFVFRGVWTLMDRIPMFDSTVQGLVVSLILGLIMVSVAFYTLNRHY